MRRYLMASAIWFALPAAAAPVDSGELARCHSLATKDERLECYEALATGAIAPAAHRPGEVVAAGPAMSAGAGSSDSRATTAVDGSAAPTPRSVDPDDPANFGLTRHQMEPQPGGPSAVKSIVNQLTQDRFQHVTVVLDNGQTWSFIDLDPRVRAGDTITIKRAALGSFLMVTPSRHGYRVERLK